MVALRLRRLPTLPTRIKRRARARTRFGWARSERATVGLAAVALGGAGAVLAGQFGRMLRAPRARATHDAEAADRSGARPRPLDTVGVAVRGYAAAPRSETVLFNLLAGFLGSFALVRLSTWGIRDRWGPFRNVRVGGRHVHHFVPGILTAFVAGGAGLITSAASASSRPWLSPFGAGIGLTFDEAALLLELRRRLLVPRGGAERPAQPRDGRPLGGPTILALRILRRGERES